MDPVLTGTNGRSLPGRIEVNCLGDQFFSRPAFALQQDGGATCRHLSDEVEDFEHRLALADDVFKVVALLERAFELNVFFFGFAARNHCANIGQQLLVVPGFWMKFVAPYCMAFTAFSTVP